MSNESTPQVPASQPTPALPQFDPNAPAAHPADDTQQLPSATTTEMPVTPPATPYAYAVSPGTAAPLAGPDVPLSPTGLPVRERAVREKPAGVAATGDGPRWNAKKTAVTAGLALVLTSAGAIGAAAAMPAGSTGGDTGFRGPGGGRGFQFPGGQQGLTNQNPNQQGTTPQQLPNLQNGVPGGGLGGIDPNQLGQLDPQDLLQQLGQGIDPFSDQDPSQDPGQDDSSSSGSTTTT
ncbi:hypothetical protein [Terracoccus sp. 273MFTsu3.1]|uniref:hypothetical protein n=1 Tax=Terracoccus sp. 273MFTsu3.1 TaxID=1172188 RepID=UPI000399D298|nr:hypothetical protein [Terracoccus sp. 273MFTsu3.1]